MHSNCATCTAHSLSDLRPLGQQHGKSDIVIALAGNPNTGKSTIFNALTGLKQHTGNWPGKTVARWEGRFSYRKKTYKIVDLPGTYSLLSTSEDEEIARNFILFEQPDVTLIIADATRLQRNLNLTLQILEITSKAILCVNLLDEAKRHKIEINLRLLSKKLGIPVVGTSARSRQGFNELLDTVEKVTSNEILCQPKKLPSLSLETEKHIALIEKELLKEFPQLPNSRWVALRLLDGDDELLSLLRNYFKK